MITPSQLKALFPLSPQTEKFVAESRKTCQKILSGEDSRLAVVVGPCSIHNIDEALDYAQHLKQLSAEIDETIFPVMRVYLEKARTATGWKGLVYDPAFSGEEDLRQGLRRARELLLQLAEKGVACATEFVDPVLAPYIEDLISWGFVGARTSASPPHRHLASLLEMPIGFKNTLDGNIETAVHAVLTAREPHTFLLPGNKGALEVVRSEGNWHTHLVLRGSKQEANHTAAHLSDVYKLLEKYQLQSAVMIDCSHGNAQGCFEKQQEVFLEILEHIQQGHNLVRGIMLESYLEAGRQDEPTEYGLSVTDPCLSWEATEKLLIHANVQLKQEAVTQYT